MATEHELTAEQRAELMAALQERFEKNMHRHGQLEWEQVQARLEEHPEKLWSLYEMERTGGEPDVVGHDDRTGMFVFNDCSLQSPDGRRSLCFDRKAWEDRKNNRPAHNAVDMAAEMGVEMLSEAEYRALQELDEFDTTTSSWVQTPPEIRKLGGALFCDRRYGAIFVYHNGASSYYAARGFRARLEV